MAVRVQALIPGLQPRRPQRQPSPHQQGQAVPPQRPRGGPKHPLQNALAGLAVPLSLLPQGATQQAEQAQQQQAGGAEEAPCEVVSPPQPADAARREMAKTIDLLLWGLAVVLLCTCCPLGLLFSLVLSVGGAGLALLVQLAATCQPEVIMQLASTAGMDIWSTLGGLDLSSIVLGAALGVAKAGKTLWLLGLDVWSLVTGLVLGVVKLGAALVLGLAKIAKALLLAGLDVWSLLVGGVVGIGKGVKAAWNAWTGRGSGGQAGQSGGDGGGEAAGAQPQASPASA